MVDCWRISVGGEVTARFATWARRAALRSLCVGMVRSESEFWDLNLPP